VALLQVARVQHVALFAVVVLHERDVRRAVRVVLDVDDRAADPVLVALEVDATILALGAAATTARRDAPVMVAAARLLQRLEQRLLRLVARNLTRRRHTAEPCSRRDRLELLCRHVRSPRRRRSCHPRRASRSPSCTTPYALRCAPSG